MSITRRVAMFSVASALALCAAAQQQEELQPSGRPVGKNCALTLPPPSSGERGEYGAYMQAFPRRSTIGRKYTGCQAVFVTEGAPVTLSWLVHVVAGEPVRIWSDTPNNQLNCHYQKRKLVIGSKGYCPQNEDFLLFSSTPSGCFSGTTASKRCERD
jgi:hypothetical protein